MVSRNAKNVIRPSFVPYVIRRVRTDFWLRQRWRFVYTNHREVIENKSNLVARAALAGDWSIADSELAI